jgi:hypothetical protein
LRHSGLQCNQPLDLLSVPSRIGECSDTYAGKAVFFVETGVPRYLQDSTLHATSGDFRIDLGTVPANGPGAGHGDRILLVVSNSLPFALPFALMIGCCRRRQYISDPGTKLHTHPSRGDQWMLTYPAGMCPDDPRKRHGDSYQQPRGSMPGFPPLTLTSVNRAAN